VASPLRRVRDRLTEPVGPPAPVAAAACFRRRQSGVQLRLVRSTDLERWTFPKRRVQSSETPSDAAAVAAAQQAGVAGVVEERPLTEFRFGRRAEDLAMVFLLAVQSVAPSGEQGRRPTWFDLPEAHLRIAEGRDGEAAQELRRVLLLVEQELPERGS
jgi:ADP-ribose pyrophosphatase YjhB (NUDIX family)